MQHLRSALPGSVFPIFLGKLVAYFAASPMVRIVLPFGIVIGSWTASVIFVFRRRNLLGRLQFR
jgi:hypothetical protein